MTNSSRPYSNGLPPVSCSSPALSTSVSDFASTSQGNIQRNATSSSNSGVYSEDERYRQPVLHESVDRIGPIQTVRSDYDLSEHRISSEPGGAQFRKGRRTDRTVRRVLWGKHIFMITVSGTLGAGFYIRTGLVLRLCGPLGALLSFFLLTGLAWAVMQCITEMLSVWPVPGALVEYVRAFVDPDLAVVIGTTYWLACCIAYAAVIVAIAIEVQYFSTSGGQSQKGIDGALLFFILPLSLVIINSLGVRLYGIWELVSGVVKLVVIVIILLLMMVINRRVDHGQSIGIEYWKGNLISYDEAAFSCWTFAFLYSLPTAAFAFIGVEIVAATAVEARALPRALEDGSDASESYGGVNKTLRFTGVWVSVLLGIIYTLGALLLSFNISSDDDRLPRVSWITPQGSPNTNGAGQSTSGFVIVATASGIAGLGEFVTIGLLLTALATANTFLYVASRTLFGLTKDLDDCSPRWMTRRLAYFGKTTRLRVPVRAIVASCCVCWVPFLWLSPSNGTGTSIATLFEILTKMTTSVILVWAVECLAFVRFHRCRQKFQENFAAHPAASIRRLGLRTDDGYPYRSHGQPFTAYTSLAGCLFIVTVANGASLFSGFRLISFLSAYLAPILVVSLWITVKTYRGGSWRLVDLESYEDTICALERLDKLFHDHALGTDEDNPAVTAWYNLWGVFERLDERI